MKKKIYLIGSGWVTKGFLDTIDYELYDVHIISKNENFVYQPFLASSILNKEKITFNLKEKYPKINFEKATVSDFNFENNKIITESENNKNYDYLILCHGSIINDFNISGIKENSYILKNNDDALKIMKAVQDLPNNANVAIMGCGLTGAEIVGHFIDNNKKINIKLNNFVDGLLFFDKINYKKFNVYAIDGLPKPLNIFKENYRDYTIDLWKKNNINLNFNSFVKKVNKDEIILSNGKNIKYDLSIWCGGIKIHPLSNLVNKKLQYDNRFGIPVNKHLKIDKLDNVWAAGDCAYSGYIPNAQVAYQQGKYLGYKFNSKFKDNNEFKFKSKGQVCYVGDNKAIYQNGEYGFSGLLGFGIMKLVKLYTKIL